MALVLRKAFLSKNASILKCMKGRSMATAANKKRTSPLFMPAARRMSKVKAVTSVMTKPRRTKLLSTFRPSSGNTTIRLQFSISCPHMGTLAEPKTALSFRQYSSSAFPLKRSRSHQEITKRFASCNGCPCPFPCCKSCGSLPPPGNSPPKCLQYMTGYYYYPYGTWFCGPYHVCGTKPDGSSCPCPCPVKCCPACVCTPTQNMATDKKVSDINQFPTSIPCHTPKIPQEGKTGMSKIFNFNGPVKSKDKQKPSSMPPVLSTLCYPQQRSDNLMDKERRTTTSYPTSDKQKPRFYHTKTNSMEVDSTSKASMQKQKNLKYFCYQKRNKVATPTERAKIYLKETNNNPRAKLDSVNSSIPNQKRQHQRPEVDIEIKPYE